MDNDDKYIGSKFFSGSGKPRESRTLLEGDLRKYLHLGGNPSESTPYEDAVRALMRMDKPNLPQESKWVVPWHDVSPPKSRPFFVKDAEGNIMYFPERNELNPIHIIKENFNPFPKNLSDGPEPWYLREALVHFDTGESNPGFGDLVRKLRAKTDLTQSERGLGDAKRKYLSAVEQAHSVGAIDDSEYVTRLEAEGLDVPSDDRGTDF